MIAVLFILLALAAMIGGVVWSYKQKEKRRQALALWGLGHGLNFSAADSFGLDRLDFHLFSLGEGRGCENVLSGAWEGVPVQAADYWYYTESNDGHGGRNKEYHRFSVVVASVDGWLPPVRVEHESPLTRLADHVGLRDIDFESEEFNRRFDVTGKDREFAFKLLDGRMLQWLLSTAGSHCYEVSGDRVLAYDKRLPPDKLAPLFFATKGFIDHVPRLVWNEYGKEAKA
jgi:hypothetical protein